MQQIFTLKQICEILVNNISASDIKPYIREKTVNTLLKRCSESEILDMTHQANCPFKKVGINQYIRFNPYMNTTRGKQKEFKGYLHYHD